MSQKAPARAGAFFSIAVVRLSWFAIQTSLTTAAGPVTVCATNWFGDRHGSRAARIGYGRLLPSAWPARRPVRRPPRAVVHPRRARQLARRAAASQLGL